MPRRQPPVVISIGGSVVVPKTGIDVAYLRRFRDLLVREMKKGRRFILTVGGGSTARAYQHAASAIVRMTAEDVDWLGIHATRLNAQLLRALFRDHAARRIAKDPTRPFRWNEAMLVAAGWKPGWSTDYVATRLARKHTAVRIVNLSNVDGVYDKDPATSRHATRIDRIGWSAFRKLVGSTWVPGSHAPFDPVASRLAERWGMEVVVAGGKDLKNLKAIFDGKPFTGTVIRGR